MGWPGSVDTLGLDAVASGEECRGAEGTGVSGRVSGGGGATVSLGDRSYGVVAKELGIAPESLRRSVLRADIDVGKSEGLTSHARDDNGSSPQR